MSMTLMLNLFLILSLSELLVMSRPLSAIRRPLAIGIAFGVAFCSGALVGERLSAAMLLFGIVSLYRVLNLLRIVKGRSNQHYLRKSTRRTSLALLTIQALLAGLLVVSDASNPAAGRGWLVLSTALAGTSILLAWFTHKNISLTAPLAVSEHFSDAQLPSLSVCIPARNETSALETCLRSLIASDYPKLEIIVLDDCSQGSRTSDIIRAFAHDGVRFIQGDIPPDGWLAKNWAYEQLLHAASGEYIVFCGVDVAMEPTALRSMITTLIAQQKRMLSIIPRNTLPVGFAGQLSYMIQPARYAWELCLPRTRIARPPVLSTCWVAEQKLVDRTGGFAAVRNTITPEAYFARKAHAKAGYGFVHATASLDVVSSKAWREQWDTAVRTRYPQLRRRPELVLMVSAAELVLVLAPLALLAVGLVESLWLQCMWAGIALVLTGWSYEQITTLTYHKRLMRSFVLAPFAGLLDVYLRHESLWRYEFSEISWKGRNICLPVMRVIPRLPKL